MRYIQLTEEMKQDALQKFKDTLENQRSSTSLINFSYDLKNNNSTDKIIVNFTATAWLKLWALVSTEKGEIGWHGLVEKINKGIYLIKDIIMYPQYVTGTTVQTDDVGYGNWLHKDLSDDEINSLRFHGHSHVNMSTSPSGVDTTWYNEILQGLGNNDFYIFGIFNKRDEYFMEVYDLADNIIYEKADITLNVLLEDNNYLNNWVTKSKEANLKEKKETTFLDRYYKTPSTTQKKENKKKDEEEDEDEVDFEDVIQELTIEDFSKDKDLKIGVMKEINKRAFQENYFNTNYSRWYSLTDYQKIDIVQKYYKAKSTTQQSSRVADIMTAQKNYYDRYNDAWYGGFYD